MVPIFWGHPVHTETNKPIGCINVNVAIRL